MRILHLSPYYRPAYAFGGVVRAVEGMATALAARGHEVTVLTTDALNQQRRCPGAAEEILDGLRVLRCRNRLPWLRGRFNLSTPAGMKGAAEAILPSIDILHLHEFRTAENLLVSPLARDLKIPIALSPHGTLTLGTGRASVKRAWDRLLSPAVARRIDQVIALSAAERAEAKAAWRRFGAGQAPTRFDVIPNGVRLGADINPELALAFRQRYALGGAPILLYLGRLQRRKGVDIVIAAFHKAADADARLCIVGPDEGMLARLRRQAAGDPRIIFTGYLAGEMRLGALAAADIFALPATGEGQPIAALEALAAGLPLLLSPGCNLDEVADYGAGYVLAATADAFAEKLDELLRDAPRRQALGANARRLAAENYTWESVAARLEGLYARLL